MAKYCYSCDHCHAIYAENVDMSVRYGRKERKNLLAPLLRFSAVAVLFLLNRH